MQASDVARELAMILQDMLDSGDDDSIITDSDDVVAGTSEFIVRLTTGQAFVISAKEVSGS